MYTSPHLTLATSSTANNPSERINIPGLYNDAKEVVPKEFSMHSAGLGTSTYGDDTPLFPEADPEVVVHVHPQRVPGCWHHSMTWGN